MLKAITAKTIDKPDDLTTTSTQASQPTNARIVATKKNEKKIPYVYGKLRANHSNNECGLTHDQNDACFYNAWKIIRSERFIEIFLPNTERKLS